MTRDEINKFFESHSEEELSQKFKKYDKYSNKKVGALITRFEFITDKGREVVSYGEFEFQLQDDGRTLKVFKNV